MNTLLFADVHLDATDTRAHHEFIAFLRAIDTDRIRRVVILGDLFDFWFEYRYAIFAGYFHVLRGLADLRDRGVELHLVCGNHDFWAGAFLRTELGIHIHDKPVELSFGPRTALLVHGDGINPKDWSYRLYKRVARARPVIALFRMVHPDWAMRLARGVSHGSRAMTHVEDRATGSEVCAQRDYAQYVLAAGSVDTVICGHTHHPLIEEHGGPHAPGLYINPGDWMQNRTYVTWDGARFALHEFHAGDERVTIEDPTPNV